MSVLSVFKIKPFDLDALYASWPDAPRFLGNPKKDPPLDKWLDAIQAGCIQRKVPQEYWHKVAQHYMGDKAKARLEELKTVIAKVQGGSYRWNWKKYKVAMNNMSWDIDTKKTETIKVKAKSAGHWWVTRKSDAGTVTTETQELVSPAVAAASKSRSTPFRSKTVMTRTAPARSNTIAQLEAPAPTRGSRLMRSRSVADMTASTNVVNEVTQAPTWLLNACQALEYLTSEHPKVMSTISAILITVGSIPALPAVAAGAGGAVLASAGAHAAGAIAVGVGSLLQGATHARQASNTATASSRSR